MPPKSPPSCPVDLAAARTMVRLLRRIERARHDPNEFLPFCFTDSSGQSLDQAPVHRRLQRFLGRAPRALVELPRDHGKSVQVCGRVVWELGRQPGLRVKLVCATEALALERGRFVREAIGENPRVRLVFPHLVPGRPWEPGRFAVARPGTPLGPSVAAVGIGGGLTGTRADLLVCDDVVDVKAMHSRAERQRVSRAFHENLMNLLEPDGRVWCLYTPWHPGDLNGQLAKNGMFKRFRRAVGPNLEPVWPAKWPAEKLAERRAAVGDVAFARAYRLVCAAEGEALIRPEWLRVWTELEPAVLTVLAVDPAVSERARADASALVVLGKTAAGDVRCLAATARRLAAPDLLALIGEQVEAWRPDAILFESNAAFAGLRDVLVRQSAFGDRVKSVVQTRDKRSRAHAFSVQIEHGRFHLKGDAVGRIDAAQQPLADELLAFPFGDHDDLLDAAAFGTAWLLGGGEPRVW